MNADDLTVLRRPGLVGAVFHGGVLIGYVQQNAAGAWRATCLHNRWSAEAGTRSAAATPGVWKRGDHYHVQATDMCACRPEFGPLVWQGKSTSSGMTFHVHHAPESVPWGLDSIYAQCDTGPIPVVVADEEYQTMSEVDAEFIVHAPEDIDFLLGEVERLSEPSLNLVSMTSEGDQVDVLTEAGTPSAERVLLMFSEAMASWFEDHDGLNYVMAGVLARGNRRWRMTVAPSVAPGPRTCGCGRRPNVTRPWLRWSG